MKKKTFKMLSVLFGGFLAVALSSCSKDDDMKMSNSGKRMITFQNVVKPKDFVLSGTFQGQNKQMPVINPGEKVEFKFNAGRTQRLMFITMYGNSNDWFFAPTQPGLALYNKNGMPIEGDVSEMVKIWDNGTKTADKKPEKKAISEVTSVKASTLMKLMLAYNKTKSEFTLTIENTSGNTDHKTPFSPGVWAVSNYDGEKLLAPTPFFMPNKESNAEVTPIAEMGDITKLKEKVMANTGIMTGISPALVVVYNGKDGNPIYKLNEKDKGIGLKDLAQRGDVTKLMASLKGMPNVKAVYKVGTDAVGPGGKISVHFDAGSGDKIAYATMFGFSNDWFYANEKEIAADYKGDITAQTSLFDSGTGVDQYPGAGNGQALFKGTPEAESLPIAKVNMMFPVPEVKNVLKITIE